MREYEIIYIVHPDLEDSAFEEVVERVQSWITSDGGEVVKTEDWGKRKLAYLIRKQSEGHYIKLDATLAPSSINDLERNFRILESILRFIIVAKK